MVTAVAARELNSIEQIIVQATAQEKIMHRNFKFLAHRKMLLAKCDTNLFLCSTIFNKAISFDPNGDCFDYSEKKSSVSGLAFQISNICLRFTIMDLIWHSLHPKTITGIFEAAPIFHFSRCDDATRVGKVNDEK